jgi:uncharacterized protein (DUF3084 family)
MEITQLICLLIITGTAVLAFIVYASEHDARDELKKVRQELKETRTSLGYVERSNEARGESCTALQQEMKRVWAINDDLKNQIEKGGRK